MHVISVFFVSLLFTLTLKAEATKSNSSYPLIFQSHHVPQLHKRDVFISFQGPGIRRGFLAHLVEALSQKKITYFIDNKLIKGDEIAESLVQAIETSSISLVIFSENYASSSWCLDELVKIVECREKKRQVLLPVFYKVDPKIVRHQNGTYGIDFDEHEMKYSLSKVEKWRYALKKAADVSGFHSSNYENDAELIKDIVKNVLKRLNQVRQFSSKQLVGIGKQISQVESLLQVDSQDVRFIGIWGMNGIGKTTIAQVIYDILYSKYEGSYFKAEVRKDWGTHGLVCLGEQDLKNDTQHGLSSFVERRLRRMKVLAVLDDVNDPQQLEILFGNLDWFGKGSRIIIKPSDKQVHAKMVAAKDIYEVKALDSNDSLNHLNLHAFEQNQTYEMEYYDLSKKLTNSSVTSSNNPKLQQWEHDTDRDGEVSYLEFVNGLFVSITSYGEESYSYSHLYEDSKNGYAKFMFSQLDKDGDGYLSAIELLPIIGEVRPSSQYYAKKQAEYFVLQAHVGKYERLNLDEMIENVEIYYAAIFRDESY